MTTRTQDYELLSGRDYALLGFAFLALRIMSGTYNDQGIFIE